MFKPRVSQAKVLQYRNGKMGVSAVPGSGKTQTLSYLAALLIKEGFVQEDQEVLIVTLVNSAVDNFSSRIEGFIESFGLLPGMSYRVRTLHGLATDIVKERPDLVGLSNNFQIIDERDASEILDHSTASWLRSNPDFVTSYTNPEIDLSRNSKVLKDWQRLAVDIAGNFIRLAKDLQASPDFIRQRLADLGAYQPLLEMGCQIYSDYQRALNYRSGIDFDDLIRLALAAIQTDPQFRARLQNQWPYILEDEAQDSSRLQEKILRLLTGENGNWVRVGDPNQAIYETFTTANPQYLLDFLREPGVTSRELPNSGRSTYSIINLANHLIDWTRNDHPVEALQHALNIPFIEPTQIGDPQANPSDRPEAIHIYDKKFTPDDELITIAHSLKKWLPKHQEETVAVLVPRNERGAKMVEVLKEQGIEYVELLRSSLPTRETARILSAILRCLTDPTSSTRLVEAYLAARKMMDYEPEDDSIIRQTSTVLRKCKWVETYLWPRPGYDWMNELYSNHTDENIIQELVSFRGIMREWQQASALPIDQLVLTISQELFSSPADLALSHKLALALEQYGRNHPDWRLPEFTAELESISNNQRKFVGFSEEDSGFDPELHKGKVIVATIHKAKGLEWDRVYLVSLNNYDFPSATIYDSFISEKWFINGKLNLPAETLAKLTALLENDVPGLFLEEGAATQAARLEYASERLRLLFVGITRAKKELVMTWNVGRNSFHGEAQPALPFTALKTFWKEFIHDASS